MTRDIPYYSTNEDKQILRIFVIRHGQTNENVKKILQGHKDTDLNEVGVEQATKLGQYLNQNREIRFDKVFSSDLKRCQQTLNEILKAFSESEKPEVSVDSGLRERCMGIIEGMYLKDAEEYALKHGKASFREFGENAKDFEERLSSKILEIIDQSLSLKNIALISHGGSIRQILKWLQYEENNVHKIIVYNTSVTIIDYIKDAETLNVRRVGNTQHLGDGEFVVNDFRLR